MPEPFTCTIVTPESKLLEEQATYVSLPAWDGQIGVEHLRAPLLVKLGFGTLRLDAPDGTSKSYFIGGGFAQVKNDKLTILADEALKAESIDRSAAEEALKQAMAIDATGDDTEFTHRDEEVSRARAMLECARSQR
jgi:F-type H+-transporting ATPase subunit epsilon